MDIKIQYPTVSNPVYLKDQVTGWFSSINNPEHLFFVDGNCRLVFNTHCFRLSSLKDVDQNYKVFPIDPPKSIEIKF